MQQNSKYSVIISDKATQMLISHVAFLAKVNLNAAERLTLEFEKTANSLEIMPQRCSWLTADYIPKHYYRYIVFEKRYMLIFQIVDDVVYVDYVIDCRQDYSFLIK